MYATITRIAVAASSIVLVLGLYAQVFKIWRTRSAKDFSLLLITALLFDALAWLNYGVFLGMREWPILLVGLVSLPAVFGAFFGYFRYGRDRR